MDRKTVVRAEEPDLRPFTARVDRAFHFCNQLEDALRSQVAEYVNSRRQQESSSYIAVGLGGTSHTTDGVSWFPDMLSAELSLMSAREAPLTLLLVFHPRHRVVPATIEHGQPYKLMARLPTQVERVVLFRARSFFLSMLEDEYLLEPIGESEQKLWPASARFWMCVRHGYGRLGVRQIRGRFGDGFSEVNVNLTLSGAEVRVAERTTAPPLGELSFSDAIDSRAFSVPRDALERLPQSEQADLQRMCQIDEILSMPREWPLVFDRFDVTFPPHSLLVTNFLSFLYEQRNLFSSTLRKVRDLAWQYDGQAGASPAPFGPEQLIFQSVERLMVLLRPAHGSDPFSGLDAWRAEHRPSFALLRWRPADSTTSQRIPFFATSEPREHKAQVDRMDWYLNSGESAFTATFVGGATTFPLVGTRYDPIPTAEERNIYRLRRPWMLTCDYPLFQSALDMVRPIFAPPDGQTPAYDPGLLDVLKSAVEVAQQSARAAGIASDFYVHYLLWYFEAMLGWRSERDCAGGLEPAPEASIEQMRPHLSDVIERFVHTMVFPESHFYALTAPVTNEIVIGDRQKLVTLSLGFRSPRDLRNEDPYLLTHLVNRLTELRTLDDAMYRERELRRWVRHLIGYTVSSDSPRLDSEQIDRVMNVLPTTVSARQFLSGLIRPLERSEGHLLFDSSETQKVLHEVLSKLARDVDGQGGRISLSAGRAGAADREFRMSIAVRSPQRGLSEQLSAFPQFDVVLESSSVEATVYSVYLPVVVSEAEQPEEWMVLSDELDPAGRPKDTSEAGDFLRHYAAIAVAYRLLQDGAAYESVVAALSKLDGKSLRFLKEKPPDPAVGLTSSQLAFARNPGFERALDARLAVSFFRHNLKLEYPRDEGQQSRRTDLEYLRPYLALLETEFDPRVNIDMRELVRASISQAIFICARVRDFERVPERALAWRHARDNIELSCDLPAQRVNCYCRSQNAIACFVELILNALTHAREQSEIRIELTSRTDEQMDIESCALRISNQTDAPQLCVERLRAAENIDKRFASSGLEIAVAQFNTSFRDCVTGNLRCLIIDNSITMLIAVRNRMRE